MIDSNFTPVQEQKFWQGLTQSPLAPAHHQRSPSLEEQAAGGEGGAVAWAKSSFPLSVVQQQTAAWVAVLSATGSQWSAACKPKNTTCPQRPIFLHKFDLCCFSGCCHSLSAVTVCCWKAKSCWLPSAAAAVSQWWCWAAAAAAASEGFLPSCFPLPGSPPSLPANIASGPPSPQAGPLS